MEWRVPPVLRHLALASIVIAVGGPFSTAWSHLQTPGCASGGYLDFDFWLGEWRISQKIRRPDGAWLEFPAHTQVQKSPDGCVITEHWSGDVQFPWEGMVRPQSMWGFSVRRFDPKEGTWSIYWMDQRNPSVGTPHVGRFSGGRGEFIRSVDDSGAKRVTRIVFQERGPMGVDWELATSADAGESWTSIWTMQMSRVK